MTNTPRDLPPRRRGFLASLSDSLAPKPMPDDDSGPLVAPKGVVTAMVLSILAGLAYLFWGGFIVAKINDMMDQMRADYADQVNECTAQFGGIGTSAIPSTSPAPTGITQTCQAMQVIESSDWDSIRSANLTLAIAFLIMGVLLVIGGWFLRAGRTWAKRCVISVTIVTLLAAFLLGVTSTLILAATLMLLVAVILCYISSGATFFMIAKERKHSA